MTAAGVPGFRANVVATLVGRLGAMAVALVFATLLTGWLGLDRYGTWSVFAAFLGFSSVLDFGLVVAIERAVAHADTAGQRARIPHLVHAARTLAALLGVAIGVLSLAAIALLPPQAWRAIGHIDEARHAAFVLPIAFALNLQAAVWAAALTGLRRSAEAHLLRVAGTAAAAAVTALVVLRGGSDVARLLLCYSAVIFVSGGVIAWRVHARLGPERWPRWPGRWDGDAARALAGVGGAVQISTLAAQAGDLALRSILGARFGPAAIGAYDLATRAAMAPRHAASAIPVALVPQAQAQAVADGHASLGALHARSALLVALVVVAGAAGAWLVVDPLLAVWLGSRPELGDVATLVRVLLVFHAALAIGAVASAIGRALGRPGPEAIAALAGNAAGIAAARLGGDAAGAVAAFAAAVAVATLAQAVWIVRRERLRWPGGLDAMRVAGVGAAAFGGTWLATRVEAPAALQIALAMAAAGGAALVAAVVAGLPGAWRAAVPITGPGADAVSRRKADEHDAGGAAAARDRRRRAVRVAPRDRRRLDAGRDRRQRVGRNARPLRAGPHRLPAAADARPAADRRRRHRARRRRPPRPVDRADRLRSRRRGAGPRTRRPPMPASVVRARRCCCWRWSASPASPGTSGWSWPTAAGGSSAAARTCAPCSPTT